MGIKSKFNELSVLAPVLVIYTLAYLALMGLDFAAKDEFDMPTGLMAVYFALLLAYATDKICNTYGERGQHFLKELYFKQPRITLWPKH